MNGQISRKGKEEERRSGMKGEITCDLVHSACRSLAEGKESSRKITRRDQLDGGKSGVWGIKESKRANQKEGNGQLCLNLLRNQVRSKQECLICLGVTGDLLKNFTIKWMINIPYVINLVTYDQVMVGGALFLDIKYP